MSIYLLLKNKNVKHQSNTALDSKLATFFRTAMQEIYWCEGHLVNVLETMTSVATDEELKTSFEEHRTQTITHVQRLEKAFEAMGEEPARKACKGLQGIFDEGWQVIDETDDGSSQRDVALIIAAQKVEHYEIACYGSLITLAKTLGRNDVAQILVPTLNEEKQCDLTLTEIAESGINEEASEESADEPTEAGTSDTQPVDEERDDSLSAQEPVF